MKIILSKQFITDFENDFRKYTINHRDLILKLKETKIINLKNPYVKIKTYINWISIRWIWIFNEEKTLVPLFFVLKKDKRYWENLILNKETLDKINNLFLKYSSDFEKWDFIEF